MLPFEIHNKEIAKLLMKTPRDENEAISNFDEFIIHGEKSIFYIFVYRSFTQLTLRIKGNVIRNEQDLQDIMGIVKRDSEFIFLVLSDSKYCEITLESYMDSLRYLDRTTIEKLFYYFFDFHNDDLKYILKDTYQVTWKNSEKDTQKDTQKNTGKNIQDNISELVEFTGFKNYIVSGIIYPFKRFVVNSLCRVTSELSGDSDWNKVEKVERVERVENNIDDINDDDEEYDDTAKFRLRRKRNFLTFRAIGSLVIFSSIIIKMIIR